METNKTLMEAEVTALVEVQASVLGGIFLWPDKMGEVMLEVSDDDFTNSVYQHLYQASKRIYNKGGYPDAIAVAAEAGSEYQPLIIKCISSISSVTQLAGHIKLLREKSKMSRIRTLGLQLASATTADDAAAIMTNINTIMSDKPGHKAVTMYEMLTNFISRQQNAKPKFINWGISFLEQSTHIESSGFVLLAGRPSAGKTALALNMAMNISKERRTGFFSYETKEALVTDRIVSASTGTNFTKIKKHELDIDEQKAIGEEYSRRNLLNRKFEFVPASGMTVSDLRAYTLSHRYEVIFIDYVQLIKPSIRADRTEQVAEISRELRELSNTCDVVVIGLVQLRRPDKTNGKDIAPVMDDIKESGQFEQDADAIMMLYLENPKERKSDRILDVVKNKEGEANRWIRLGFKGELQRFTAISDMEEPSHIPKYSPPKKKDDFQEIEGYSDIPEQFYSRS